jgi:GAF domain-containing protein
MRKLMNAALIAATLIPASLVASGASAQSRGDLWRYRQEIMREERDLQRAQARGNVWEIRRQQAQLHQARAEYRTMIYGRNSQYARGNDWRDDDRYDRRDDRGYRRGDGYQRDGYRRDEWDARHGF